MERAGSVMREVKREAGKLKPAGLIRKALEEGVDVRLGPEGVSQQRRGRRTRWVEAV